MSLNSTINLLVLSNQILYIEALKLLLQDFDKSLFIDGFSTNHPDVRKVIAEQNPDVLLLDANGMDKNIWDFLHVVHKNHPDIKVIMLANSDESIYQEYAHKNGASGYVLKSSPKEILMGAIKIVFEGGSFYDPGSMEKGSNGQSSKIQQQFNLSSRELEIITLIKEGLSTKNIASQLGLSFHTIEAHRKNIYSKLKINKVTELLNIFAELG